MRYLSSAASLISRRFRTLLAATLLAAALMAPAAAHAAAGWQSGPLQETGGYNCITGDPEFLAGSFLSYYADPASPPKTGQVFYVSVSATGIGNTCPGIYAYPQLILPSGVSLAISAANPVQCFFKLPSASQFVRDTSSDCPQNLGLGPQGYSLSFVGVSPSLWPLPIGGTIEMHVPVVASVAGALTFHAYIQTADGEGNGSMSPSLLVIVNNATTQTGTSQIGIEYNQPSISAMSIKPNTSVTASFTGIIDNHSLLGTGHAQLTTPTAGTDCSSVNAILVDLSAPLQSPATQIIGQDPNGFTGLTQGVAYCWRLAALITNGPAPGEYDGNWQPFVTPCAPANASCHAPSIGNNAVCTTGGGGCTTSTCSGAGTCGAASCSGPACLTSFAPGQTTVPTTPTTPTTTTTPPPPPPPPPLVVLKAPSLITHKASAALKGGIIVVTTGLSVSCPAGGSACPVSLTATISGAQAARAAKAKKKPKPLVIGRVHTSVAAGKTAAVTFKLSSKAVALLKRHKHLKISLTGTASTGAGGPKITISKSITVNNPPVKKHKHR